MTSLILNLESLPVVHEHTRWIEFSRMRKMRRNGTALLAYLKRADTPVSAALHERALRESILVLNRDAWLAMLALVLLPEKGLRYIDTTVEASYWRVREALKQYGLRTAPEYALALAALLGR